MDGNDYITLLEKYHRGETSPGEERRLLQHLGQGSGISGTLEDYYSEKWKSSSAEGSENAGDYIKLIKERLDTGYNAEKAARTTKRLKFIAIAASAACLALALVFGIEYARLAGGKRSAKTEVFTENGQKTKITLPDGTSVWMNSGSEISYDGLFGHRTREVSLEGEAFFEVAKDGRRPFIVHTSLYDVKAVGTSFNVSSYDEDRTSVTTLMEGRVEITSTDKAATEFKETLNPSEYLTYDREKGDYSRQVSERASFAAVWRDNELVVAPNTTLEEFVKVLEREYNIEFVINNDKIRQFTFEGVIKNSQLSNVLEIMGISAPITYRIEKNRVVLDLKD